MDTVDEAGGCEIRTPRRDVLVSTITMLVGAAVVAFLTQYNMQPYPVWWTERGAGGSSAFAIGRSWEEYLIVNVTGLLLVPMLAILAMPREQPAAYGWARPDGRAAVVAVGLFGAMLPVLFVASRMEAFQRYYPMQPQAATSWSYLLYFELTYGLYMLTWEFFFRGFLTFGMSRGFGAPVAVIVQAVAFGVMHVGKPTPEIVGSFAAGLILGVLALRGRSFMPCFALHWACAATFDLMVIRATPGGIF